MEIVEICCPRSVDLKYLFKDQNNNTKNIFQSVNIYDKVIICKNIEKKNNILIECETEIDDKLRETIQTLIILFFKYNNINVNNLIIKIEKNETNLLNSNYNILAGILVGLNVYYNTNLSTHQLLYLSNKINPLIAYYIICGYKKIDINNKNYNIGENQFKRYLLLDNLDSNKIELIKKFMMQHKNIDSVFNGDVNFIALKDNYYINLFIWLKKEFNDIKIINCENVNKNKILKKYLNYFE